MYYVSISLSLRTAHDEMRFEKYANSTSSLLGVPEKVYWLARSTASPSLVKAALAFILSYLICCELV